ncbi:unnamed protein product [Chrysoparadoxa australica]
MSRNSATQPSLFPLLCCLLLFLLVDEHAQGCCARRMSSSRAVRAIRRLRPPCSLLGNQAQLKHDCRYQAAPGSVRACPGGIPRAHHRSLATRAGLKEGVPSAYPIATALDLVKSGARAKFVETVEIAMKLGVDPRKPNESVRGTVVLPHGTGKEVRVAVFAKGDDLTAASEAGAEVVGSEELVELVKEGKLDFDRVVATPEMMPHIGKIARILGPRGMMPNPKLGTMTKDVVNAVKTAKAGQVQFRAYQHGMLMAPIGKVTLEIPQLMENLRALMIAISNERPKTMRGKYMLQAHISSTNGKGVKVDLATIDPSAARFMRLSSEEKAHLIPADEASKTLFA